MDDLCAGVDGSSPPPSGPPTIWAQESAKCVDTRLNEEAFRDCRDPTSNRAGASALPRSRAGEPSRADLAPCADSPLGRLVRRPIPRQYNYCERFLRGAVDGNRTGTVSLGTDSALGALARMAKGTRSGTGAVSDVNESRTAWAIQSNTVVLQRFSCVERVTGIEPALSAWEEFLSSRVSVSCNDIGGLS